MSSPEINIKVTADTEDAKQKLGSVSDAAKGMSDKIESGNERAGRSYSDMATKVTAVAGTAMTLYDAYDRIEHASLRVERAQFSVTKATENLDQKQKALNEVIAKYGENSEQAKDAADQLAIAQDRLSIAQQQLQQSQQDMNRTYISAATTSIPMMIMALDKLKGAYSSLGSVASGIAGKLGLGGAGAGGLGAAAATAGGAALVGALEIPGFWSLLQSAWSQISKGDIWSSRFSSTMSMLGNPSGQMAEGLKEWMKALGLLPKEVGTLADVFDTLREKAFDAFKDILDEAKEKLGDIKDAFEDKWKEITKAIGEKLVDPAKKEFDKIKDAFTEALKGLPDAATSAFQQVIQAIQSALQQATQAIQQFAQQTMQSLQQIGQSMSSMGQQGMGGGNLGSGMNPFGTWNPYGSPYSGGYTGYPPEYGTFQGGWDWGYNPPGSMYFQGGAVFNKPTRLRDVVVAEDEPEILLPASKLRGATGGGHVFHFTMYINEVVNAKDPSWRRELARDILNEAYEALRRGTAL